MASHSSSVSSPINDDKEKYAGDVQQHVAPVKEEAPETFYASKYGALGSVLSRLFASGVEARGVERVPEDQRESKRAWNK